VDATGNALAQADHFLAVGRPERALQALERAGGEPGDARFWLLRTAAFVDLDRYPEALKTAREGLRLEPESVALLDLASESAAELGDVPEAERLILAALRLEPDDPVLLSRYALLLARGRQLEKADRVVSRAEAADPDHPSVVAARWAVAYFRGDDRKARKQGEHLLAEWDPDHSAGHAMLGTYYSLRGGAGRASRHLNAAARYDVTDHELADAAREARVDAHRLLFPMRLVDRWGPARLWLVGIGVGGLLLALGWDLAASLWLAAYLAIALYSWTVAPLARRLLRRQ
jgi:tetratricopeptide (TPR) repeat protein